MLEMWQRAVGSNQSGLIVLPFADEPSTDLCGWTEIKQDYNLSVIIPSVFLQVLPVFFCLLLGSFLTELPWLRRRTGLVSHFLRVFPERLGPGELDCSELRDGCG